MTPSDPLEQQLRETHKKTIDLLSAVADKVQAEAEQRKRASEQNQSRQTETAAPGERAAAENVVADTVQPELRRGESAEKQSFLGKCGQLLSEPRTWIEILATLFVAALAYLNWGVLNEMKKQPPNTAVSNEIDRKALISAQRAFLVCDDLNSGRTTVHDDSDAGFRVTWSFVMPCQNTGTTPANVVASATGTSILDAEPPEDQFIQTAVDRMRSVIGPKSVENMKGVAIKESSLIGQEFSPADVVNMRILPPLKFTKGHFIWGWVGYYDVFPNTPLRVTEFCRELTNLAIDRSSQPLPRLYTEDAICERHNCADEYCEDYDAIVSLVPKR